MGRETPAPEAPQRSRARTFFHVDPSLVKRAEGLGLYVFGLERNLIEVLNSAGFQPRAF